MNDQATNNMLYDLVLPNLRGRICTDRLGCYFFSGRETQKFGDSEVAGSRGELPIACLLMAWHGKGGGALSGEPTRTALTVF